MRILGVYLQDFRNIAHARIDLGGRDAFFLGSNAQGKTALLEACGLLTAMRSFRTGDLRHLIRHHSPGEARVRLVLEHEQEGAVEVEVTLRSGSRTVLVDGEKVRRLQDFVGHYPTIPICSDDIELLRGSPLGRRRFLDLILSGTNPVYYEDLRRYTQILRDRNLLLKRSRQGAELAAFDIQLAATGSTLVRMRAEGLDTLNADLSALYQVYAPDDETVQVVYRPQLNETTPEAFREALTHGMTRDLAMGTTLAGPHRDDFQLNMQDRRARDFGSEGQQRGMVLALKLAAFRRFRSNLGITPVVLADDVLNELDQRRRRLFWDALEEGVQVIATGTQAPSGERPRGWQGWWVEAGHFSLSNESTG